MRPAAERLLALIRGQPARTAAVVVGLVAFAVYAATAVRGVSFGDWAEAQVVPAVLGIMHPTGYPTYTLLGWLVDLIPVGSPALKANLLSGACTAGALAALSLILSRLAVRPVLAVAAPLALGFTANIWLNSVHASVHTLHLLFVALLLHRLLVWAQDGRTRDLYLGALLLGLSFGNHLLTLTLAPAIVLGSLWLGRKAIRARPRILLGGAFMFLVGISVYLYLPLRSLEKPPVMYADLSNLSALFAHVTGSQFSSQATGVTSAGPDRFVAQLQAWLAPPGGYVLALTVGLAVFGLALLWRARPGYAIVLVAVLLVGAYFDNNEDPGRRDQYIFASAAVMILFLGAAAEGFIATVERAWRDTRLLQVATGMATALILLVPLLMAWTEWPLADQAANDQGQQFVDTILADLPQGAVLYDLWDIRTTIEYAQQVEGRRKDITLTESPVKALAYASAGRPVYVLQVFDYNVTPISDEYPLTQVASIYLPYGGIAAPYLRPLYRVDVPTNGGASPGPAAVPSAAPLAAPSTAH